MTPPGGSLPVNGGGRLGALSPSRDSDRRRARPGRRGDRAGGGSRAPRGAARGDRGRAVARHRSSAQPAGGAGAGRAGCRGHAPDGQDQHRRRAGRRESPHRALPQGSGARGWCVSCGIRAEDPARGPGQEPHGEPVAGSKEAGIELASGSGGARSGGAATERRQTDGRPPVGLGPSRDRRRRLPLRGSQIQRPRRRRAPPR